MSEPRLAALVCEGQTDVPVFRRIIQEVWPSVEEVRSLQPELDESGRARGSAGWTGVRAWCKQHAGALDDVLSPDVGSPFDLLVIAVDVDIAIEAKSVDPPRRVGPYESARLQDLIRRWLGTKLPNAVVISTPVLAIEAWILAALFPKLGSLERLPDPAQTLVEKKKLRTSPTDGKPWKELHVYRQFGPKVARALGRVRRRCPEADRTCQEIENVRDAVE